jgi:hypothetical protein
MTIDESVRDRPTFTYARRGSPLACFGVQQSATRLYFIGADSGLKELAITAGGPELRDIFTPMPETPLTCFGINGTDPCLFYRETDSRIWAVIPAGDLPKVAIVPGQAAADSPLACVGLGGTACRLYYLDTSRQVHQVASTDEANFPDQPAGGASAVRGSDLSCTTDARGQGVAFYIGAPDHQLNVVSTTKPAEGSELDTFPIDGTDPAPGSALACFNVTGQYDTHVYYLDRQNRINELEWKDSVQTNQALPYHARPGSALTCFGYDGKDARLYYLDDQARVNELARVHGAWVPKILPGTAAPDSALACYGANGKATRLYYLDPEYRVNELAWQGGRFVNTPL